MEIDYICFCFRWEHVCDVKKFQDKQLVMGHRLDRHLTEAHIVVTNYEKMNLKMAVDVFSLPIERIMEDHVPGSEGMNVRLYY